MAHEPQIRPIFKLLGQENNEQLQSCQPWPGQNTQAKMEAPTEGSLHSRGSPTFQRPSAWRLSPQTGWPLSTVTPPLVRWVASAWGNVSRPPRRDH